MSDFILKGAILVAWLAFVLWFCFTPAPETKDDDDDDQDRII